MTEDVFSHSRFACSTFSVDEDVGTSGFFEHWSHCFTQCAYLILSVREPVRQVIVSQDLSVSEQVWSVDELFEYVIEYVWFGNSSIPRIFCRGNTDISCGEDKGCSTKKLVPTTTILKRKEKATTKGESLWTHPKISTGNDQKERIENTEYRC